MRMALLVLASAMTVAGCMRDVAPAGRSPQGAQAVLRDVAGAERGTVRVTDTASGARVTIEGIGLPPGTHGLHVHAVGRCDPPGFDSAGPHWNPTMKQHGRDNPMGAHHGDLPNLTIGGDGRGSVAFDVPKGSAAVFDEDGSAIVVHAGPDDYKTDPSGNSGARIACGVLTR